jgi:hypothetical protein
MHIKNYSDCILQYIENRLDIDNQNHVRAGCYAIVYERELNRLKSFLHTII